MKQRIKKFATWMDQLKRNDKTLLFLIGLDLMLAIASNVVDWPWLMSVDWYLLPFAPICSLFPLTLAIWLIIYRQKGRVAPWFTSFIFIGLLSYGIIAQLYYPVYISQIGFHWRLPGNMLWVALYGVQTLVILSEIKPVKIYQLSLIMAYYLIKDYSDRYLGSFIDDAQKLGFPIVLKDLFFAIIIILQCSGLALAAKIAHKTKKQPQPAAPTLQPQEKKI